MKIQKRSTLGLLAGSVVAGMVSTGYSQAISTFTYGDLVVLQGVQTTGTGTVAAYLDEYSPYGLEGQVAIPTNASGSNNPLTLNNATSASHEGILTLSENQQYLTFAGYNTGTGSTNFSGLASGTIGIVNFNTSTLSTSTVIPSGGENVRAATTIDGKEFYVSVAHGTVAGGPGGLNYVSGSGPTATNTVLGGLLDSRSVQILGGSNPSTAVLSAGTGSSSFNISSFSQPASANGHGVFALTGPTGGLPTSSTGLTGADIIGDATDGSDIVYDTEPGNSNSYHGYNTMYVAGNTSANEGYIEKFSYNGSGFAPVSLVETYGSTTPATAINPIGITVQHDSITGNTDVFYTETTGIYELNTLDNSTSGFLSSTSTVFATAPAGSAFYGIANAPVPEPTTLGILAVGAVGMLGRRKRRA